MAPSGDLSRRTESGYSVSVTEKLYYDHPPLLEFDASIVKDETNGALHEVVLDRTCFFPGGGGQPPDRGLLGIARVVDVKDRDGEIVHVLDSAPIGPGTVSAAALVHGVVDAARRLDFMAQHSGQHVLSQALLSVGGLATVSVHFGEETTTIELETPVVPEEVLRRAEQLANSIIRENRQIRIHEVDPSEASRFPLRRTPPEVGRLRIVEVDGFDWAACSGLHVAATGQIILVKIVAQEKIRGRARILALIGARAMEDYGRKAVLVQTLMRLLTCGESDIAARVEELARSLRESERELGRMRQERAVADADSAAARARALGETLLVRAAFDGAGPAYLKAFAERAVASPGRALIAVDRSADAFQWIVAHSLGARIDLPSIVTPLLGPAHAKGGGRGAWMQGAGRPADAATSFGDAVEEALSRSLG
jgi:alanyl-tRNA synthetase